MVDMDVHKIAVNIIRMQAIRGLPLLCKDTPQHLPKIADVLGQLLLAGRISGHAQFHQELREMLFDFDYVFSENGLVAHKEGKLIGSQLPKNFIYFIVHSKFCSFSAIV